MHELSIYPSYALIEGYKNPYSYDRDHNSQKGRWECLLCKANFSPGDICMPHNLQCEERQHLPFERPNMVFISGPQVQSWSSPYKRDIFERMQRIAQNSLPTT